MAKTNVYDMTGKVVGEIELNDAVFGIEPNTVVMHEAVKNYLANQRQGTQSTLTDKFIVDKAAVAKIEEVYA